MQSVENEKMRDFNLPADNLNDKLIKRNGIVEEIF